MQYLKLNLTISIIRKTDISDSIPKQLFSEMNEQEESVDVTTFLFDYIIKLS